MSYEPEPRNGKYMDEDCYREGRKDKPTVPMAMLDDIFASGWPACPVEWKHNFLRKVADRFGFQVKE